MSEAALSRISNFIKVEDDLQKIETLRTEFTREKTSNDVKLNHLTQLQIDSIVSNLEKLKASADKLANVKSNVEQINAIHDESITNSRDYDTLKNATAVYETMMQVQNLYADIANFRQYVEHIGNMIASEYDAVSQDIEYPLTNILRIHYNVTQARNFVDYLEDEVRGLLDDTQSIVRKIVAPMRKIVRSYDELLKEVIVSVTEAVKEGNEAMVNKIVRIIELEAGEDRKLALTQSLDLLSETTKRTMDYSQYRGRARNYHKFFYDKLEESLAETFSKCVEHFSHDAILVYDNLDWLEDELLFVERTLAPLFPVHWKISAFIHKAYFNLLHEFTMRIIQGLPPAEDMMRILAYDTHYAQFVTQLHDKNKEFQRSILGEELKDSVLDDYSKVIVTKMTEWNDVLMKQEAQAFVNRSEAPDLYSYTQTLEDIDQFDHVVSFDVMTEVFVLLNFKTTLAMLKEQADVAADSGYGKVLVEVVENWAACYIRRIEAYKELIHDELAKYLSIYNNDGCLIKESKARRFLKISKPAPVQDIDNMTAEELSEILREGFVEYLTALGNTYEINGERLQDKFLPKYLSKVHSAYQGRIIKAFEDTLAPGMDLNALVIRTIVDIIINDLYPALSVVFTSKWYENGRVDGDQTMAHKIVETIVEYMEELKGYATYDIYNLTFSVLLDQVMTNYLRIGYLNILHGDGRKIDPTATKKSKSFSEALNRDIGIIYESLDHLFSRKDAIYLVKSLSSLEFLIALATCESVEEDVPEIWEHEILETYYDCSVEYVRGALLCRKDVDAKSVGPIIERLSKIKDDYHASVPAPELAVVTLNGFSYT